MVAVAGQVAPSKVSVIELTGTELPLPGVAEDELAPDRSRKPHVLGLGQRRATCVQRDAVTVEPVHRGEVLGALDTEKGNVADGDNRFRPPNPEETP